MASSYDEHEEWDKRTSEIQSEDSDDLHENRPNRWRGPPQSWRTITEEERLTYNALQRLRNQDLSLHLYNAWALKQRPPRAAEGEGDSQEEDVDAETGQAVIGEPWAPPRSWTAWPVPPNELPPDDFMKTADDEDEAFTFRRLGDQSARSRLEEVISATTLRFAKERLRRRGIAEPDQASGETQAKEEPLSSEYESQASEAAGDDDEGVEGRQEPGVRERRKGKRPVRTFKPVVSTDDDVSYDLIRPSTTRILEKLDRTLTILHNSRMASAQNLEDSEDEASESEGSRQPSQSQQPSRPGNSPEQMPSRSRVSTADEAETGATPERKSSRGRPRKYVQREGESERDFLIRRGRALKGKYRLPLAEDGGGAPAAGESQSSPPKRRRGPTAEEKERRVLKKLGGCRPRDWRDVMGAAALAGFPPDAVARAIQRCADLFGQGMEMHTIKEVPASCGHSGVETKVFRPGGETPPSSPEAEDDIGGMDILQARSLSGRSSAATSRQASPTSDETGDEEGGSPKKSQKRRGKDQHFCPYSECDRSLVGFGRPFNLRRHVKLVHGTDAAQVAGDQEAETDGMLGGVHRDGFLEPIRVRKGWRAEDTRKRARARKNA